MLGKRLAVRVAALLLGLLTTLPAGWAAAYEVELPGERKAEIVGFYELRARVFGEDLPANGMSLSSFRHVLNIETDIDIFPDGWGPFDVMVGYTRWLVSYECVYRRSCGIWDSADSYGGAHRTPIREPKHFKRAYSRVPWVGGVLPQYVYPGTNLSTFQPLTPGRRYRTILNADGVYWNPFPLAAFANLNTRTVLDQPIDAGTSNSIRNETRAGTFSADKLTVEAQLNSLRQALPRLTGYSFAQLTDRSFFPKLEPETYGVAAGLIAQARRAERDPALLARYGIDAAPAGVDPEALRAQARAILGDPSDPDAFHAIDAFFINVEGDDPIAPLVPARTDPNKFLPLAQRAGGDLLTMRWGATARSDATFIPWLATIDTAIRPTGYFTFNGADLVNEFGSEVAKRGQLPFNFGVSVDSVTKSKYCLAIDPSAPCISPDDANFGDPSNRRIGVFFGPDGIANTDDDLPILRGPDPTHPLYLTQDNQDQLKILAGLNGTIASYRQNPADPNSDIDLVKDGVCRGDGVNANGECVLLLASSNSSVLGGIADPEVLTIQGDASLRPPSAVLEPTDVTDMLSRADGQTLPARPSNPAGGLFFYTSGHRRLIQRSSDTVGNLDVHFKEDELAWEHGGGQDEHEFREGYLEFEMMDSEVFARAGKLFWVWGKTELFRNQDRLNPLDIGLGTFARLEEARMGQWGIQLVYSPEAWMSLGPVEDLRLEMVVVADDFEPTDLGKCGEALTFEPVCYKTFGAMAPGLTGIGLVGEVRPDSEYGNFLQQLELGLRLEGRWDRFTFALTDYWGYDDSGVVELVHQYQRRVDPETGAPVRVDGTLSCKRRTNQEGQLVGPDGVPETGDEEIASVGNCLLFEPDPDAPGTDRLRLNDQIALDHYANQTLFHTICTLTFDEDTGYCAVDTLNAPALTAAISQVLAGGSIGNVAIQGARTIRTTGAPFTQVGTKSNGDAQVAAQTFGPLRDLATGGPRFDLDDMDYRQRSLLGCGPGFATGCGANRAAEVGGGIDFMNADASILTQEFSILKVGSPGALVGTRNREFGAGVSRPIGFTPAEAAALGDSAHLDASDQIYAADLRFELASEESGQYHPDGVTPLVAIPKTIDFLRSPLRLLFPDPESIPVATDFMLEGSRWLVDEEALAKGVLLFEDPRIQPDDPRYNPFLPDTLDPDRTNPLGENCSPLYGGPEPGCTNLEILSANLERFSITNEIIGGDDVFDPPESFVEVLAMLDGDPSNDGFGDPISGPDGIFFNNWDSDGDGIVDRKAVRVPQENVSESVFVSDFSKCEDALASGTGVRLFCFQKLGREDPGPGAPTGAVGTLLAHAMPIGISGFKVVGEERVPYVIPIDRLDRLDVQRLAEVGFEFSEITVPDIDGDGLADTIGVQKSTIDSLIGFSFQASQGGPADLDNDSYADLDENRDGVFDFVDDGTLGPIDDDNILCGSGIPGDLLQEAKQTEYANSADMELEVAVFGESGLPPRSPIFCAGISGILNITGQTLPFVRAGGDGGYGRRDFLWQGGRQLAFTYHKKNVAGFSLDFAEDRTKSSWGIEFSLQSDKLFGNTFEYDGLSKSDEYLLTISVDRPTFFNFLNPNRSFFLNFQLNMRWLPDYEGGPKNKDGMFGSAARSFTTFMVFTFFTGYFQDRLQPSFNLVADPYSSSGAILSQVSYRWNERFSTAVRLNHFFGHPVEAQGAYFPVSLYTHPDFNSDATRGLAVVKNRDVAILTVRYTF